MIFCRDLRDTQRALRTMYNELKAQSKIFPCFKIMRTRSRGKEIYCKVDYSNGKRKRTVIHPDQTDFFNVLKGLCIEAKKEIVEENILLLKGLEERYRDVSPVELIDLMEKKYPKIDRRDIIMAVNDLEQTSGSPTEWGKAPYKRADFMEDGRTQITSRGLKVRSKSEAAICEILYANDIEFRYEEVIYLNGRRFVPDFIIRRKSDGKIFYWEHCGMMDDPAYRRKNREKLDWYEMNDIVPWDNLIVTYDKDGTIDLSFIEAIVKAVLAA